MNKTRVILGISVYLAIELIITTRLQAQTPTTQDGSVTNAPAVKVSPPDAQEAADSKKLIDAVNSGDTQATLDILQKYGVADNVIQSISSHLNTPSTQVELKEPFLKASLGALALTDRSLKTNAQSNLSATFAKRGYERPIWIPRPPDTRTATSYEADLLDCPEAPILFLEQKINDPCFIRFFKLYEHYADRIHSVVVNGSHLNNARIHSDAYGPARRQLNAMFKLIKACKPDVFVWLAVVKQDNHSDETWLKSMAFMPDGLQILNLSQFHSPFVGTRQRYQSVLGADRPMMVSGFLGYSAAIKNEGTALADAIRKEDGDATTVSTGQLGGIGATGPNLSEIETNLQALGYRGISVSWLLLMAQANATNATAIDTSDLPAQRIGLLDLDYDKKDYSNMVSVAEELVKNSAPGDVNWTAGKLYQGIGLLKQSKPDVDNSIKALDDVINFKFTNRLGRDHYILGAVKWRIYAAALSGDKDKIHELVQWVRDQPFPINAKSALLKQTSQPAVLPPVLSKKN